MLDLQLVLQNQSANICQKVDLAWFQLEIELMFFLVAGKFCYSTAARQDCSPSSL